MVDIILIKPRLVQCVLEAVISQHHTAKKYKMKVRLTAPFDPL